MLRYYYCDTIEEFQRKSTKEIFGIISSSNQFDSNSNQNKSWEYQIELLKNILVDIKGTIFFEFSIPRMGKRVDCILIIKNVVFVIEFKIGEAEYLISNIDQVWDYALDLKNFHEPSHNVIMVPILVASEAKSSINQISFTSHNDKLAKPLKTNKKDFGELIKKTLLILYDDCTIDGDLFAKGSYSPSPSIIESAVTLYKEHTVKNIIKNDADNDNLSLTTTSISKIIEDAKIDNKKVICFVTGVPGAGKTLIGLDVATKHLAKEKGTASIFLSGNDPLVKVLQEALARDKFDNVRLNGEKIRKSDARSSVKTFIQIIHHYRDEYLDNQNPPFDHVAIFDEAQRAWNKEQTVKFMKTKKGQLNFDYSEPEFLISCLNRHKDWAVVVCLVGGGQEINTGEAGISEWLNAIYHTFPEWQISISHNLTDSEYSAEDIIEKLKDKCNFDENLHLKVSMRSFRAENVSLFVKQILDINIAEAQKTLSLISKNYPIVLTRDLSKAKNWLREKARGSERYGIIVSSQAQRLKPLAIDVKSPIDPIHWFLDGKDDVRSSYYLEDVATEFQIQGLELEWACVTWDGDLRYTENGWTTHSFVGNKWQNINKEERKKYLINAYRVLLTRARQGMVIVVPEGNTEDPTRNPIYYDETFEFLLRLGIQFL